MTEENWTSESSDRPAPKKGLPKWLWFLGCGCLTMVLIVGAGGFFLFNSMKGAMDPEVQWPALAEVLEVEEPYPDYEIIGMGIMAITPGIDGMWTLVADDGRTTTVVYALSGDSGREMRDALLSDEGEVDIPLVGGVHDLTVGTIMIQGRELDCARFTSFDSDEMEASEDEDDDGEEGGIFDEINKTLKKSAIRIDATPEGVEGRFILLEMAKAGTLEPLTDEQVAEFLAPFHIGPDR